MEIMMLCLVLTTVLNSATACFYSHVSRRTMSLFNPGGSVDVYVDGVLVFHRASKESVLYEVGIPNDDSVIVVQMTSQGSAARFAAADSAGQFATDSHWYCSNVRPTAFDRPENFAGWSAAVETLDCGMETLLEGTGAKCISTADGNSAKLYCTAHDVDMEESEDETETTVEPDDAATGRTHSSDVTTTAELASSGDVVTTEASSSGDNVTVESSPGDLITTGAASGGEVDNGVSSGGDAATTGTSASREEPASTAATTGGEETSIADQTGSSSAPPAARASTNGDDAVKTTGRDSTIAVAEDANSASKTGKPAERSVTAAETSTGGNVVVEEATTPEMMSAAETSKNTAGPTISEEIEGGRMKNKKKNKTKED
jgi:hypothetical protein